MTRCPSDLELEKLARQPEDPAAAHVFSCARCAARLAEMRRLAEEFEREVFPATIEAVVQDSRRSGPRAVWLVPAAAAAALLVTLGVLWAAGGRDAPIELAAWAGPEVAVADGQAIPAGTVMRFEVRPRRDCTLWMASADASGNVTRVYPPKALTGTKGLRVEAGKTVAVDAPPPEGEQPGPERYFAVCLREDTLHWKDVDRAARSIGPGVAQVRSARTIPGLPGDAVQVSLLVERRQ